MTDAGVPRAFAGVFKILRFNLRFYVLSGGVLAATGAILLTQRLPRGLETVLLGAAAVAAFWTISSLLVSWYVYDYARLTGWAWLHSQLPCRPHRWASVHAGLDESTPALRRMFPGAEGVSIDIYSSAEMTEPSIARARALHPAAESPIRGASSALPLPAGAVDAVFLLLSAHELRTPERRTDLLCECARVLEQGGFVVLVEHLRDWRNFLAYGPGFFHFHSWPSWQRNIRGALLRVEKEFRVTPFVRCLILRKAGP